MKTLIIAFVLAVGLSQNISHLPNGTPECKIEDAKRVMNAVAPYLAEGGGLVTEFDFQAVYRPESVILRHRADLLDARDKARDAFLSVLACLNNKNRPGWRNWQTQRS